MLFWFHVGEGAFAISFLLNVTVRLPLVRRARRGAIDPRRVARVVLALATAELTVLYLAVAGMVVKPDSSDTGALATGSGILAVAVAAALVIGTRSPAPSGELAAATVPSEREEQRAA